MFINCTIKLKLYWNKNLHLQVQLLLNNSNIYESKWRHLLELRTFRIRAYHVSKQTFQMLNLGPLCCVFVLTFSLHIYPLADRFERQDCKVSEQLCCHLDVYMSWVAVSRINGVLCDRLASILLQHHFMWHSTVLFLQALQGRCNSNSV